MTSIKFFSTVMFCMLLAMPVLAQDVDVDKAREAEKQLLLEKLARLHAENFALKQQVADLQAQMQQLKLAAKPAATSQPTTKPVDDNKPLRTITSDELCVTVEKLAQKYKNDLSTAKTTIEKDDLHKQLTDKVSDELKSIQLVVEYDVKDVRMTSDDVADLSCGAKYMKFSERKDAEIHIGLPLPIKVNMTREEAKNINKGDKLIICGKPSASNLPFSNGAQIVLSLGIKGRGYQFAYVSMKDFTIKINDRAFTSPYAAKP